MIIDIIKDGSLERLLLVIIVFGGIVFLLAKDGAVDERLFDVAFVIIGFYFGSTIEKTRQANRDSTKVLS